MATSSERDGLRLEPTRDHTWRRRALGALAISVALLGPAACSNPVALEDVPAAGEHTTSSTNHTSSSGNALPR